MSPSSFTILLPVGTQFIRVMLRNGSRRRLYIEHSLTLPISISLLALMLKRPLSILVGEVRRLVNSLWYVWVTWLGALISFLCLGLLLTDPRNRCMVLCMFLLLHACPLCR